MIDGSDLTESEVDAINANQLEQIRTQQRINRRLQRLQCMAYAELLTLPAPQRDSGGDDRAH